MASSLPVVAATALWAALLAGCTEGRSTNTCVPGLTVSCACTDGRQGAQACNPNGTFDACDCAGAAAGPPFDAGTFNVDTLAGNGSNGSIDGDGGLHGTAEFQDPNGVAVDGNGSVYVADYGNNQVRKVNPAGNVTTLAGTGTPGFLDGPGGPGGSALLHGPFSLALDAAGNVYVADSGNNRIRRIDPAGNVTTFAGNGTSGDVDGTGGPSGTAEFADPFGIAADGAGGFYVADRHNNRVRKIDAAGNVTTFAGSGALGSRDGTGGRNGNAQFAQPTGLSVDAAGNVFVADYLNRRIRKIDPHGDVTTLAGNGTPGYADGTGGAVGTAEFGLVVAVAADAAGNVWVADGENNRLRVINAAGDVATAAGNGKPGYVNGPGGPEGTAEFAGPSGLAFGSGGVIYVADNGNNSVRVVTPIH